MPNNSIQIYPRDGDSLEGEVNQDEGAHACLILLGPSGESDVTIWASGPEWLRSLASKATALADELEAAMKPKDAEVTCLRCGGPLSTHFSRPCPADAERP